MSKNLKFITNSSRRQLDSTSSQNAFSLQVKEVGINYDTSSYEDNPKIQKLKSFLPKFELDEKEKYTICVTQLQKTGLLYSDGMIYKGTINANGKREGYGKMYIPNGSIFEGFFKDNKMQGRGRMLNIDGYVYEGDFHNSQACGYGKLVSLDGTVYKGSWQNDKQNGIGYQKYADQSYYVGNFLNGAKNGKGTMFFKKGSKYEGEFSNNEIKGEGIRTWKDGRIYCGTWNHNKMEGYGIFFWPDKKRYYGHYDNDTKDGFGVFYWNNGKKFEGFWKDGKQHGYGYICDITDTQGEENIKYGVWERGKNTENIIDEMKIEEIRQMIDEVKNSYEYLEFQNKVSKYEENFSLK